ncbi:macro domain-containing protein [Bacillus mycoides]|uniref:macro domain-containing protein n=1 Tax=Bacillus mycoides TaxID=1405 RepID=UPI003D007FD9
MKARLLTKILGAQKVKVRFSDEILRERFNIKLTVISTVLSLLLIGITIPDGWKVFTVILLFITLFILYIGMWVYANRITKVELNINNSTVHIKLGNVFEADGLKVISFNEYLDTRVDDSLISSTSLNGQYINNIVTDVSELNNLIDTNQNLERKIIRTVDNRPLGNKKQYKLGTIFKHNDYLLTAFSKFDEDNRAYLSMNDYINCLMNFWNEIDIIQNGKTVTIPLLGSGITRFKEYPVTEQELLELLLWTFKISRVKFPYPAHITVLIQDEKRDKINFYKLRSFENGL